MPLTGKNLTCARPAHFAVLTATTIVVVVLGGVSIVSSDSGVTPFANDPVIVVGGAITSGATTLISIEGVGPGEGPTVLIRLNGWIVDHPTAVWNPTDQVWEISWDVPPDQSGGTVTIHVVTSSCGSRSASFSVR